MNTDTGKISAAFVAVSFGVLLIVAGIIGYLHTTDVRNAEKITIERELLVSSLHRVYDKLSLTNSTGESLMITSADVRRAIARGTNVLGELPAGITANSVFIRKASVPRTSGEFVCVVRFGKRPSAYGLTSTGQCRRAASGELITEDFAPIGMAQ